MAGMPRTTSSLMERLEEIHDNKVKAQAEELAEAWEGFLPYDLAENIRAAMVLKGVSPSTADEMSTNLKTAISTMRRDLEVAINRLTDAATHAREAAEVMVSISTKCREFPDGGGFTV